jgi:hypothetical protein
MSRNGYVYYPLCKLKPDIGDLVEINPGNLSGGQHFLQERDANVTLVVGRGPLHGIDELAYVCLVIDLKSGDMSVTHLNMTSARFIASIAGAIG